MSINPDRPVPKDMTMEHVERAAKFRRLAGGRTNTILKTLRLLQNCANRSSYFYTEEQVDRMFARVREQVDQCEAAYREDKKARNDWFEL